MGIGEARIHEIPLELEFQVVWVVQCECWDSNEFPLQEEYTLLTTKPSL